MLIKGRDWPSSGLQRALALISNRYLLSSRDAAHLQQQFGRSDRADMWSQERGHYTGSFLVDRL